jgi:hypothetical protein
MCRNSAFCSGFRCGALAGEAASHECDERPVQVSFGVREAFVVPCVAAGVRDPSRGALDAPAAWEDDEAFGAFGAGGGLEGDVGEVLGPGDELAGVGGVGPDLGDLRVREAKAPEEFAGGVAVLHVGGVTMIITGKPFVSTARCLAR